VPIALISHSHIATSASTATAPNHMAAAPAAITHRLDVLETNVNQLILKSRGVESDPRHSDWNWANCGRQIKANVDHLNMTAVPEMQQQLMHIETETKENGAKLKKHDEKLESIDRNLRRHGDILIGVQGQINVRMNRLNRFRTECSRRFQKLEMDVAKESEDVRAQVRRVANQTAELKAQVAELEKGLEARSDELKEDLANRDEDLKASINKRMKALLSKQSDTTFRAAQTELHTELRSMERKMDRKFKALDTKMESMDTKFVELDTKIDTKFDQVLDMLRSLQ